LIETGAKFQIATHVVLSNIKSFVIFTGRGAGLAAEVLCDV